MQVTNLNSSYSMGITEDTRNTGELGKDDFLKLFVEQLKAQDPLSPMDNNEFIAQSAQFTQLEQMTNLNTNISKFIEQQTNIMNSVLYSQTSSQALGLVDKYITAYVDNGSEGYKKVEGIVDKIVFNGSYQVFYVGDQEVFLEEIAEVKVKPEENNPQTEESNF